MNIPYSSKRLPLLTREGENDLGRRIAKTKGAVYFDPGENALSYVLDGPLEPGREYNVRIAGVKEGEEDMRDLIWSFRTSVNPKMEKEGEFRRYDGLDIMISPYDNEETSIRPEIKTIFRDGFTLNKSSKGDYLFSVWDKEAVNALVSHNTGLVFSIARSYLRYSSAHFEFADLVQIGNIGLFEAARRFDYATGYKFSTYATWWIRQAIRRGIERERAIRLPSNVYDKLHKIRRIMDMRTESGLDTSLKAVSKHAGIPEEEALLLITVSQELVSINAPLREDSTETLESVLGDGLQSEPIDHAANSVLRGRLEELFVSAGLSEQEEEVIRYRFGLDDGIERTLEEVGHIYELTRERIRQIEKKALNKLRGRGTRRLEEFALS